MFRSATTRIAHNSIVPSLAAVNKDLKALQDLINAEKSVLQSLQKLSIDFARAAEALRVWGNGEGDDLGDTLAASSALLVHFSSALSRFSGHEATVREQMKAVRTREENLDEMKRRRKALGSKADSADKKLNKMSSENKNFQSQADSLNRLREEIRVLDTDIMNEETSLQDFKRYSAKSWMGVKYGALMECCEKGAIVSELGKLVIAEIPLNSTDPGMPRPYYTGHANTDALIMEASRRVQDVQFFTEPSASTIGLKQLPGPELPLIPVGSSRSSDPSVMTYEPSVNTNRYSQSILSPPGSNYIGLPDFGASNTGLGMTPILEAERAPPQAPGANPFNDAYGEPAPPPPPEMGEFGVYSQTQYGPRSTSLRNLGDQPPSSPTGPRGARFATFPVKATAGPRPQPPPQSPMVAFQPPQPLGDRAPSLEVDRPADSFSDSIAEALGTQWSPSHPPQELRGRDSATPSMRKAQEASMHVRNREYSPPPPMYTPTTLDQPDSNLPPSQPPQHGLSTSGPSTSGHRHSDEEEETALAYMSDERPPSSRSDRPPSSRGPDRRVTFGSVHDDSEPPTHVPPTHPPQPQNGVQLRDPPATKALSPPRSPTQPSATPSPPTQQSPPNPTQDAPQIPSVHEDDEQALNAAAAREVSRELDALMFNSPIKPAGSEKQSPPPLEPLQPPQAAFARRTSPGRLSFSGEPLTSPTSSIRNEPTYIRERDRPSLSPTSDNYGASQSSLSGHTASAQPTDNSPLQPPPPINERAPSPAVSYMSAGTPYKTPPEMPIPTTQPAGPGSFYNLPAMSGSGTFTPGGTRTISAAAFKRQLRSPSSPPPSDPHADATPLNVRKRTPGSPLIAGPGLRPDAPGTPRIFSAPNPGTTAPAAARPLSANADDDEYDYISAYVDESPAEADYSRKPGPGGYEQGRFATNLEHDNSIR